MDQRTWIIWLVFTLGLCGFVALEIGLRYFRYKHEPSAWTPRVATIGVAVWTLAVMVLANFLGLGWTLMTILTAIIVGAGYAVAILLVGRAVRQRVHGRVDDSRRS